MKNKERQLTRRTAASMVLLCLCLLVLLLFSQKENNARQMRQINEYISELSERTAQHVGDVFEDKQNAIDAIAYLYGRAVQGEMVDRTLLRELEQNSGFDMIRFVNAQGESFTSDGESADVADRDYAMMGLRGESGCTVVYDSRFSHERLLGFYAPVVHEGEICGVMVGFLDAQTVSDILRTTLCHQDADTLIVDDSDLVLGQYLGQGTMDMAQLRALAAEMPEMQQSQIAQALDDKMHLVFQIDHAAGCVTPIHDTQWMLLQFFPASVATSLMDEVNHHEHVVMSAFALVSFCFFLYMMHLLKKKHDIVRENANTTRFTTLLQNVADDYLCLMDVNLATEREEQFRLYSGGTQSDWMQGSCDYAHCMQSYAEQVVLSNDRKRFLEETSLENLRNVLKENEAFYLEYDARMDGRVHHLQAKFTVGDDVQSEQHMFVGIRDMTALTKERAKHKTRMKLVLSAASTIYPYIMEINLTKNHAHTICDKGLVHRPRMERMPLETVLSEVQDTIADAKDYEQLLGQLNREAQICAYTHGKREIVLRVRQWDDAHVVHWMEVRAILMQNEESDLYSICLIRCVDAEVRQTEEMRAGKEAAESANRAKSAFLFNMSHDIRTPMNAIMGFSAMAEKHLHEEEKLLDCLKKINMSGEHLLRLINNVLDMARIESGKMKLDIRAHNIVEAVKNEEAIFQADVAKKHIDFHTECDVQDEIAFFDLLKMTQISLNLISNAVKYTPEGGKVVYRVSQTGRDGDRATYECRVTDNGIGISEEFQKSVFEAFERENSTLVSGVEGTGLGLAIVYRLVKEMGGKITCRSEIGKGTEFCCTYTLRVGTADDVAQDSVSEHAPALFQGKRVLLVEDNELNREISRGLLEDFGIVVTEAENGRVAVELLKDSQPGDYDVVLMDVQMPIMNGYEATRAIRAMGKAHLRTMPIIAVTANAFAEDRQTAMESGMNGHVAKPVGEKALREALQRCWK